MGSSSAQNRTTYHYHHTHNRYHQHSTSSSSVSSSPSSSSSNTTTASENSSSETFDSHTIWGGGDENSVPDSHSMNCGTPNNTTGTNIGTVKTYRKRNKGNNGGSKAFSSSSSRYSSCKWSRILIVALCQMASVLSQGKPFS